MQINNGFISGSLRVIGDTFGKRFATQGGTSNDVVLGTGLLKSLTDLKTSLGLTDSDGAGIYLPLSGGTMTGTITTTTGHSHDGVKVGDTYITAIGGNLIFLNNSSIRFGGDSWDYNVWAGLKYVPGSKTLYLGLADNNAFTANSAQTGGKLILAGVKDMELQSNNTDSFITFQHTGDAAYDWRVGMLGSGSGEANYFVIQSNGSDNSKSTTWVNAIRIGLNTKDILLTGNVSIASNVDKDFGTPDYRWRRLHSNHLYLCGATDGNPAVTLESSANNPRITFMDSADASLYAQLIYTDYDTYQNPDSLTLLGSQSGTYFIAPHIRAKGRVEAQEGLLVSDVIADKQYIPSYGIYSKGDLAFSDCGTGMRLIKFTHGGSDYSRIAVGATASDSGWLEIATADNATEPIYVRQYEYSGSNAWATIKRTLTLLDSSGNTSIPGNTAFGGNLTTTATTKTKDIGATSARWKGIYSDTVDASTKVTVGSGTIMYNSATGCLEITA